MDLELDDKAAKLTAKVNDRATITLGDPVVLAVPVKNGSVAAGLAVFSGLGAVGALAVEGAKRAKEALGRPQMANAVKNSMGRGNDQILCFGKASLRIVRLIGFGKMGSEPTVVMNADIRWVHTDEKLLAKQAIVLFNDGSMLTFKIPRTTDRDLVTQLAAQLWERPEQLG